MKASLEHSVSVADIVMGVARLYSLAILLFCFFPNLSTHSVSYLTYAKYKLKNSY